MERDHRKRLGLIKVSYRMTSAESALVETCVSASGRETLTLYHRDGASVLATHYCAQQNQPRLKLEPKSSNAQTLTFAFKDATNLSSAAAERMTRLVVTFIDVTHFDQTATYSADGKSEATVLHFVRAAED